MLKSFNIPAPEDSANSDTPYLKIGYVASILGISTARIRLWEEEGLVSPSRTSGGQRRYSAQDIQILKRIRDLLDHSNMSYRGVRKAISEDLPSASCAQTPPAPAIMIGERAKWLRKQLGLSLRDLSHLTSVSPSALSAFERGLRQPNTGRISMIAHALGITTTELLGIPSTSRDGMIVRSGEREQLAMADRGVKIELMYRNISTLQSQSITVEPDCGIMDSITHEGEDFVTVIKGEINIVLDGVDLHHLEAGDSITFPSDRPHTFHNPGPVSTHLIWINTPPTF